MTRPRFVPEGELKKRLLGVNEPQIFYTPQEQNKVYQNAIRTVDLDPERIAVGAYLDLAVVKSALKALFQGIADVCLNCNDLLLGFEVANIEIVDKRLSYTFTPDIAGKLQSDQFEKNVDYIYKILESRFLQTTFFRGDKSSTQVAPSHTHQLEKSLKAQNQQKTALLAVMSNDMNTVKAKK